MNLRFDSISKKIGNGFIDGIALVEAAAIVATAGAAWMYLSRKDRSADKSVEKWAGRVQARRESEPSGDIRAR